MRKGKATLSVLVVIIALVTAAYISPSVEGESSRTTVPDQRAIMQAAAAAPGGEYVSDIPADTIPVNVNGGVSANTSMRVPGKARGAGAPTGYRYWKTVRAKVTAYDPSRRCCGPSACGRTSIGENAWVMDGVAADPIAIPYGTYCMVPGVGGKTVDDTGSAMRRSWRAHGRYHIDVRVPYYNQAKQWGVRYLDIKLYKKVK